MEGFAFDRLARAVGVSGSRRGLLRLAAGLALAGLLTRMDEEGTAKRKRHGRRASHRPGKGKDRRKGQRQDDGATLGEPCSSSGDCRNGKTCCSGTCVNLQNDNANCGSCGNMCQPFSGPTCVDGSCTCTTVICSGSGCCPTKNDVCNQNDECCTPKTCEDFPAGTCGPQDDGCGGTTQCPCCPNTPCDCPAGRTLCDSMTGPLLYCAESSCLCVERADDQGSVCYSGDAGACFDDDSICASHQDCEEQNYFGFLCVKTGTCSLGCFQTACVSPCSENASGSRPNITVLHSGG